MHAAKLAESCGAEGCATPTPRLWWWATTGGGCTRSTALRWARVTRTCLKTPTRLRGTASEVTYSVWISQWAVDGWSARLPPLWAATSSWRRCAGLSGCCSLMTDLCRQLKTSGACRPIQLDRKARSPHQTSCFCRVKLQQPDAIYGIRTTWGHKRVQSFSANTCMHTYSFPRCKRCASRACIFRRGDDNIEDQCFEGLGLAYCHVKICWSDPCGLQPTP